MWLVKAQLTIFVNKIDYKVDQNCARDLQGHSSFGITMGTSPYDDKGQIFEFMD